MTMIEPGGLKKHDEAASHRVAHQSRGIQPSTRTPYWLLWSTGVTALVLSIIAFVLWGVNGSNTLFDMIVALCT